MKNEYESEILEVCHKDAVGMFELGLISSGRMKEFDEVSCLENPRNNSSQDPE